MDKDYWNNYYKKNISPKSPSPFALDIYPYLKDNKKLLELGCGNGRDSIFFGGGNTKLTVLAIDQSEIAIENLKKENHKNITFIKDNFINSKIFETHKFDYVYSRFTLHSITENEQEELLDNVSKVINKDGMLFIEARSVKDTIYGLGEQVGLNEYIYNEHYRRFIVLDELINSIEKRGFKIIFGKQSDNWAIHGLENPIVIRIHAQKI